MEKMLRAVRKSQKFPMLLGRSLGLENVEGIVDRSGWSLVQGLRFGDGGERHAKESWFPLGDSRTAGAAELAQQGL